MLVAIRSKLRPRLLRVLGAVLTLGVTAAASAADLRLLFMGDNGHHQPAVRFHELAPALEARGISLEYTEQMEQLNAETLAEFDGLVLYANIDRIEPPQAKAVLDYVASGKAFVPLHCATYCWRNNDEIVALMGGQFKRHGGQVFGTEIAEPEHPVMQGFGGFVSWDETYIHHLHNEQNRTVLEYRVAGEQDVGKQREPWTWVRTHGQGRVFYTAWGHDARTFSQPGFHNLVERGIRWACGDDPAKAEAFHHPSVFAKPEMTKLRTDVAPFEFIDVGPKIPNYTPGQQWGTQGEPRTLMQKPLPPDESIKHFVTPKGLAVRLYADEQHFQAKPIAMNWDERGRLWICETVDYPNELGGNRDRIRICTDTDGDDVADQFTVFAEGLSIPTAIVIMRGGAVVQNGTETIYLKDLDGDDVADEKTVLISNWKLGDTHGGVSNFRYGLDNWIWAMQGYNNSTPEVDGKPVQTFRMGFWRFKLSQDDPPRVTDLEFIRSSNNNTWGLGISEEGLIFGSTANHNPSMFVPIPNRYYESVRGWAPATLDTIADSFRFEPITDKVRQVDQFGGYTAGAGHALYTARAFPQQWWNSTAFVCGPTGHLVGTFVLQRDGANYGSTSPCNLLASDDEWSAPIMAEVGPDGAVWVIDWYNYIVQHNPTPQGFETGKGNAYESDLRDKKHGRIYRVVPENANSLHTFVALDTLSNVELVNVLKHPSMNWRLHAQRLILERQATDVLLPLIALLEDGTVDQIGLNVGAIHALQTLHGLGYCDADRGEAHWDRVQNALQEALTHASAGVRRNAIAVLPNTQTGLQMLAESVEIAKEADAQVQLQAILKLAEMPVLDGALVELAQTVKDPVLVDAVTAAAAAHSLPFLASLCKHEQSAEPSTTIVQVVQRIAEHIGRGKPQAHELARIVTQLQTAASPVQDAVLEGLTRGLPVTGEINTSDELDQGLLALLRQATPEVKRKVLRCAAQFGTRALDQETADVVDAMLRVVTDTNATDDQRVAAARDLVGLRPADAEIVSQIVSQLGTQANPDLRRLLLDTLRASKSGQVGESIIAAMPNFTPQLRSSAIGTLLSRPDWVRALLSGLDHGALQLSDLSLDQQQSLRAYPDPDVRAQAKKLLAMDGGLPDEDREKVLQSLLHTTNVQGDVEGGKLMFTKHCAQCHMHGELGKAIGPNLTGMSVHPKAELLTNIIDPSRSVEGNFRIYTVVRSDGSVANGMLTSETRTSISLIDTDAKEASFPREDIEELIASRKSLMPEGFEKQMTEAELVNLLEFLAFKGKYVPILLDSHATAVSTKGLFSQGDGGPDRMVFPDWKPKMFAGIPFVLTDPLGGSRPNIILLHGPQGRLPRSMPKSVTLLCNTPAKSIHLLSGVGGWSFPSSRGKTVSMIVRLHYADGTDEDHELFNGVHFADYIRRVDVPESEFAFALGDQQIRHLAVEPKRDEMIKTIELLKGTDDSAPIVMAVTIER